MTTVVTANASASLSSISNAKRLGRTSSTFTSSCVLFALIFMTVGSILTLWFVHITNGWGSQQMSISEDNLTLVNLKMSQIRQDQEYLLKLVDKNMHLPSHHQATDVNTNSNDHEGIKFPQMPSLSSLSSLSSSSSLLLSSSSQSSFTLNSMSTSAVEKSEEKEGNPIIEDPLRRHPILGFSDEKFMNTPLSEMYKLYGQASGGGTCEEDFGYKLVEKWKECKKSYCQPKSGTNSNSNMDCYLIKQTRHHGSGDNLCRMRDVSMEMSIFNEEWYTDRLVKEYVDTKHRRQPYIDFPKGFIESECSPTLEWQPQFFPGWNWNVSYEGFKPNSPPIACDITVDHNVLLIQRDTFANFFHDSEDFFNYFVAMSVLDWSLANTQVYLTDLYPEGPFWPMWDKVFSGKHKTRTAFDLGRDFKHAQGKKVCFKNLGVGIYGPASPITVASWDTPCRSTALVKAYSDFVIRGLGLHKKTVYLDKTKYPCPDKKEVVVTFLARRSSIEWPEKKFCNDTHSFFLCQYWSGSQWGVRKLGRVLRNEGSLISTLKTLERYNFPNGAKVKFQDVDFNVLSFEEQILVDLETDVLIGPHGAGLMHNIFMPDRATLIELFIDGSGGNRHFHNLAHWYGRDYNGVTASNPIDERDIFETVKETISNMKFKC